MDLPSKRRASFRAAGARTHAARFVGGSVSCGVGRLVGLLRAIYWSAVSVKPASTTSRIRTAWQCGGKLSVKPASTTSRIRTAWQCGGKLAQASVASVTRGDARRRRRLPRPLRPAHEQLLEVRNEHFLLAIITRPPSLRGRRRQHGSVCSEGMRANRRKQESSWCRSALPGRGGYTL